MTALATSADAVPVPVKSLLKSVTLSTSSRGFHVSGCDRVTGLVVATWDGKDPVLACQWLDEFAQRVVH